MSRNDAIKEKSVIKTEITAVTNEGSGVSRYNGAVVFTPFTAPGDLAQVRIEKVGKSCVYGRLERVLEPSADRADPVCPVFGECGGCALRRIDYAAETKIKTGWVKDHISRIGGFDLEPLPAIPSPKSDRYRNKAVYQAGRDKNGRIIFGFYRRKSHEIINCENCLLQPEEFAEILKVIKFFAEQTGLSVYDEKEHRGLLRAVYIRKGEVSGETGICIVVNGKRLTKAELLVSALSTRFPDIVSIVLNINEERTNVVLGKKFVTLFGKDGISDTLCGVTVDISPAAFYQVNHGAAELLYRKAAKLAALTGEETLLDLYCGAGTIGLSMAAGAKRLIGVEIVPQAVENARRNAERMGVTNAEFICGDAAEASQTLQKRGLLPDVVVLDPPRKGCDLATLEAVAAMRPKRIVMVSCDTATMARDFRTLAELGYVPKAAQPVDMFPRTANVECAAVLERE